MAAAPNVKLVEAVVAPGRSVHVELDGFQVWDASAGKEGGGAMVDRKRLGKPAAAGETVLLAADEVKRLQDLGFLVVPGAAAIPRAAGPSFGVNEGPKITEGA